MRNKKVILSSVLSLVLCLSLAAGGTFALFTSNDNVNIAITSGNVAIVAEVTDWELHSLENIDPNTFTGTKVDRTAEKNFITGGTAELLGNQITLTNIVPGDGVSFNIKVTNNSNVAVKYRTVVSAATVNNADGSEDNLADVLAITIRDKEYTGAVAEKWVSVSETGLIDTIPVAIDLPAEVDKEWMNKSISLTVSVEAVQGNTLTYDTVYAASNDDLTDLITEADVPTEVELPAGDYTLPTENMQNKDLTFSGNKDVVVDLSDAPLGHTQAASGATVNFDGITVKFDDKEDYTGLAHTEKVVYKNCTIYGKQTMYSDAEFIGCTFINANDYSVWTWGARNITFTNCTFQSGGKALLVYADTTDSNVTVNVTLNNCTFDDDGTLNTVKAAVETGKNPKSPANETTLYNITMNNCTVNGFAVNDEGISTGTTFYGNKNSLGTANLNVVIDGTEKY